MCRTSIAILLLLVTCTFAHAKSKMDAWKAIPRGANIFSENPEADLDFARANKIQLLRMGAVGQHQDFRWLIKDDRFDLSEKNILRLKAALSTKKGFLVVLSLAEVPGRRWRNQEEDFRIWDESKHQDEFVRGWRELAKILKDEPSVIGFDLINEPYFRKDQDPSKLDDLYTRTIKAIREVDKDIPIVVEPAKMGSMDALEGLARFDDPHVIYSFHYYEPWEYFSKKLNKGKLVYPGNGWDLKRHQERFNVVKAWAKKRGLKPYQVFLGEFGVWKDATGADQYLKDVLSIVTKMGWPWAYYAFREHGWDNANLEKGPVDPRTKRPVLFEILRGYL